MASGAEEIALIQFDLQVLEIAEFASADLEVLVVLSVVEMQRGQTMVVPAAQTSASQIYRGPGFDAGLGCPDVSVVAGPTLRRFECKSAQLFGVPTTLTPFFPIPPKFFQLPTVPCSPWTACETVFAWREISAHTINPNRSRNGSSAVQAGSLDSGWWRHLGSNSTNNNALMAIGLVPVADRKRVQKVTSKLPLLR